MLLSTMSLLFIVGSCSKTARTEKNLYKNNGKWNITSVVYSLVVIDENETEIPFNGTISNAGTFTFEEGGAGSYNFILDGKTFSQTFAWTAEDYEVAIVKYSQNVDFQTGDTELITVAFGGERTEKDKLILSGSETFVSVAGSETTESILSVTSMTLVK